MYGTKQLQLTTGLICFLLLWLFAASAFSQDYALKDEVFQRTNDVRTNPVYFDATLDEIASIRASEVAETFSHTRPNGLPWNSLLKEFGVHWSACAENIAFGQSTAAEVMNSWLHSPGHRANILNESYTHIGIGVTRNHKGQLVWTQIFARFQ
ncbi:MAG: hypothetical protein IK079_02140 [Desulfovibrio sp.]|nr:hypothetical protein [Desulfovibrio sp.]